MDFQNYYKQLQEKAEKMTNKEWTVYIENMIKLQDKIYSETADEELLNKCLAESASYFLVKHICNDEGFKETLLRWFREEYQKQKPQDEVNKIVEKVKNVINDEKTYNGIIENNHTYIERTALQIDNLKKYKKTQEESGKPFNRDEFNEFLGFNAIYHSILKEKTESLQMAYEEYIEEMLVSVFMQIDREYFPCIAVFDLTARDDKSK